MDNVSRICKFYHTSIGEVRDQKVNTRGRGGLRRARKFLCWYYRSKGLSIQEVHLLTNIPVCKIGDNERFIKLLISQKDTITLKLIEKL